MKLFIIILIKEIMAEGVDIIPRLILVLKAPCFIQRCASAGKNA